MTFLKELHKNNNFILLKKYLTENGEVIFPVSEVTIAGNMLEMFKTLMPASDLKFQTGIDAPTFMVENMTVAGI